MKEFYGNVSITAKLSFSIEAKSKEEAIEKIFSASCPISLIGEDGKEIEITDMEWDMIQNPTEGNVRESNIESFYIEEED